MDYGGCCYVSLDGVVGGGGGVSVGDENEVVIRDLNPLFDKEAEKDGEEDIHRAIGKPLFPIAKDFELPECSICFETIEMINISVTTCGHSFHSSCLFKSLQKNETCPLCRHKLVDIPEDDEDEEDDEEHDEDDDDEDDDEDDEDDEDEDGENENEEENYEEGRRRRLVLEDLNVGNNNNTNSQQGANLERESTVTIDELTNKLVHLGYTPKDFVKLIAITWDEVDIDDFDWINKFQEHFSDIIFGKITMSHRDNRSYASVVRQNN
jgi:hypothetical protein